MSGKKKNGVADLRKRAEETISQLPPPEDLCTDDVRRIVHELKVHQIELEMQNDALRETQAELLESNSRYTDLYDFSPVGYLSVDDKSIILEANLTLARLLHIERGNLIGRPFPNFIAPGDKAAFRSHLVRIFETQGRRTLETMLVRRGSGDEFPTQLESIYIEDVTGRKQCRISVADISERKTAEKAASIYLKRLEQSNRELQDFAFIASHDLREPLRKIQAFGDRIKAKHAGSLDYEGRDFLDRMINAAKRMSDMIHGLLSYSRVGAAAKELETVDLKQAVEEAESDLYISIEKGEARIEVGRLPFIQADPNQMRQLFQNLISNSLKFHGEAKSVIKIYSKPTSDKAHIVFIEDSGIGFEEKYLDRIFDLFQRLQGRSAYEGTGLGLAICRRIVDRHHGTITARSKPGEGATFIITLPEKQPSED